MYEPLAVIAIGSFLVTPSYKRAIHLKYPVGFVWIENRMLLGVSRPAVLGDR
jgi:hypothetical protein